MQSERKVVLREGSKVEPGTKSLSKVDGPAKRLGVDEARVYEMAREHIFPPGVVVKLGRNVRFDMEKLETWIESGGQALPGGWRKDAA